MNIVQSIIKAVNQPPQPMHVGEVFNIWSLYLAVAESRIICQLLLNHTNDTSLKEMIEHFIDEVEEPAIKQLKQIMLDEGITIPPGTGDKPKADEGQIPPGAKLTDAEIANLIVVKLEGMLQLCTLGIGMSLRDDVGMALLQIYQHVVVQGFTVKKLMRERGWLRIPPYWAQSMGGSSTH